MLLTRRHALHLTGAAALTAALPALAAAQPKVEEGFLKVPGGKVWYRRVGGDRPGTPLLLLHGGPGGGHDYLTPMQALADQRPVILYDQLGCGRSDAPDTPADETLYRIPRFVEEVDAVRDQLGLSRIHLFGNSWGSMLAIEYMITTGGRGVEKLILSGALASVPQCVAGMNRLLDALPNNAGPRVRALIAKGDTSSDEYNRLVQVFYERHVCRRLPWPDEVNRTVANIGKSPAYRIMNGPNEFTIVGNIKDWERRPDLGRIRVPTLITTGAYDEVTLDCHQSIRDGIAGSKLIVMPGCSHTTMDEQPAEYNVIVRRFLA
jgi:proline iminopeptidase